MALIGVKRYECSPLSFCSPLVCFGSAPAFSCALNRIPLCAERKRLDRASAVGHASSWCSHLGGAAAGCCMPVSLISANLRHWQKVGVFGNVDISDHSSGSKLPTTTFSPAVYPYATARLIALLYAVMANKTNKGEPRLHFPASCQCATFNKYCFIERLLS